MKIAADIEFIIDNTVSKVESASGDRGFKFNIDTEQLSDTVITALRNRYKCAGWKYMALRPRHDTISHDVVGYTITLGM